MSQSVDNSRELFRIALSLFAAACLAAFPLAALGAEETGSMDGQGSSIVIVGMKKCCTSEAWPEAEEKTKTELASIDFEVIVVDGKTSHEEAWEAEIKNAAGADGAIGALRIVRLPEGEGGSVDVWIRDGKTGESVFWQLAADDLKGPDAAAILALRVVELVRASVYGLKMPGVSWATAVDLPPGTIRVIDSPPQPPEAPPAPSGKPIDVRLMGSLKKGDIGLRLGFSGLGSTGGTGGQGAVEFAVRWNFVRFFSMELGMFFSVVGRDIVRLDESASFDVAALRGFLLWEVLRGRRLKISLGAGVGVLFAWSKGKAPEGVAVSDELGYAAYIGGSAQLAVVLIRYLWLRTGFSVGTTVPREIAVRFGGDEVASFGRPVLEGFLGMEVRVP